MKKIAYLMGEYPRATDTFIQREIIGLRDEGFELKTISVRRPSNLERGTAEQEGERLGTSYLLPSSPFKLLAVHFSLFIRNPQIYLRTLKLAISERHPGLRSLLYQFFYFAEAGLVARIIRKEGIEHIHNHAPDACGYVTMLACELEKATFSMTLHGYAIFSNPDRWSLREKLKRCLFAVCISQHGISQAMLNSSQSDWQKLQLIHCGVDPNSGNELAREHKGVGNNLLFIGRLDHVKGIPVLLDAIAILKEQGNSAILNLVGDGPVRKNLEKIVEDKGLTESVIFHGYKSQNELKEFFSKADATVITSFFEGIPVVLMESLIHSVPVIAPRITGIPELVEDGINGLLTTPANPEELAIQIKRLLDDPDMRNQFAKNGKQKVKNEFNLNHQIDDLVTTMKRLLF